MFGRKFVRDLVVRSTDPGVDRRNFLQQVGVAGAGAVGVAALGAAVAPAVAGAAPVKAAPVREAAPSTGEATDIAVLKFALNLEYLEAEFYHQAAFGKTLPNSLTGGIGGRGFVMGGKEVPFASKIVRDLARNIAGDEQDHVAFLRTALGSQKLGRPALNIRTSFTAAAQAAGLISKHQTFDPYANENNFLLAAFIFEDVGVTAYKGAAPLITNKTYLEAAAGILAAEAYHASAIRTLLFDRGLQHEANAISKARDSLDGKSDDDKGITFSNGDFRVAPLDANGIAYSRTPGAVLNVVYLNPKSVGKGGFLPAGTKGPLHLSG